MSKSKEDDVIERQASTLYGYIVEWRLRPGSEAIGDVNAPDDVKSEWSRGPYRPTNMLTSLPEEGMAIIRPYIDPWIGEQLARHGLVTEPVAIATLACLKTMIDPTKLKHIEWRIEQARVDTTALVTRVAKTIDEDYTI